MCYTLSYSNMTLRRKRIVNCTCSLIWAKYHPSESQIMTLSVDATLSYWEVLDGEEIRALTVGKHSGVSAMDVDRQGESLVIGDINSEAAVWRYRQGSMEKIARAECGRINRILFSSGGTRQIVAASDNGAIIVWINN